MEIISINPSPTAIEEWAKEFDRKLVFGNKRQFTQEEAKTYMYLMLRHKENPECETDPDLIKELEKNEFTGANILWRRIKYCHTFTIEPTAALALGMLILRPGHSTILANYLQYKCFEHGINQVNLHFISEEVFPHGVPTEEFYQKMWYLQKTPEGSNLLDNGDYAASIKELPDNKYISRIW